MRDILYLCNKKYFDTKMSRVRFHAIEALEEFSNLKWSGIGWDNYDNDKTVQENIDTLYPTKSPDIVIAYKPLEMKKYHEIKPLKCIRYNEMWDKQWTMKEIMESRSNLVICHHSNEAEEYTQIFKNFNLFPVKFIAISHCAEKTIFKDYGLEKSMDLLLIGELNPQVYPLRRRFLNIFKKMSPQYKCVILNHPNYIVQDAHTNRLAIDFAKMINSAKIAVTCGSIYKYRLGKYIEVPMCNTALAADMPKEDDAKFNKFLIQINMEMSDEEIIHKLEFYLENESKRKELIQQGKLYAQNYTQEHYAQSFLESIEESLR